METPTTTGKYRETTTAEELGITGVWEGYQESLQQNALLANLESGYSGKRAYSFLQKVLQ